MGKDFYASLHGAMMIDNCCSADALFLTQVIDYSKAFSFLRDQKYRIYCLYIEANKQIDLIPDSDWHTKDQKKGTIINSSPILKPL